jgi:glycosyltransferase involved in cell wall biosynthesis
LKLSIIIPSRIDRGYLRYAIQSVKNQTYQNIELIVQRGDYRVGKNINDGIAKSTGDLITWLPDDDLLPNNAAEIAAASIGNFDFIHGNAVRFKDVSDRKVYRPTVTNPTAAQLAKHNHIHGGTVWYRRETITANKFNEDLWTGEEYELHLRMLTNGCKLGYVNEIMFYYRLHQMQKSIGQHSVESWTKRMKEIQRIKQMYR